LDVLTLFHHEAHVSPISAPLPSFELMKAWTFPSRLDGFFGNMDDPIMIRLLEHSPKF